MRHHRVASLLALASVMLAACDVVDGLVRGPDAPVYGKLEVWNRTTEPLFLVDREGRRLDVPACGHAVAEQFEFHEVRVRHEDGYVLGFGGGSGTTQYLVLVARSMAMSREEFPPAALPPCAGRPEVQVGV